MKQVAIALGVVTAIVLAGLVAWFALQAKPATGPALMDAVSRNDLRRVREILARDPALVNFADEYGNTPLHRTGLQSLPEIAEFLLRLGADKTAKNDRGLTPADEARAELERARKDGYSQQGARQVLALLGEEVREPEKTRESGEEGR